MMQNGKTLLADLVCRVIERWRLWRWRRWCRRNPVQPVDFDRIVVAMDDVQTVMSRNLAERLFEPDSPLPIDKILSSRRIWQEESYDGGKR